MIVVINLWSFFIRIRALTPQIVSFPSWLGGATNGFTAFVIDLTNESRGFVDHSRGGVGRLGSATAFLIGQVASSIDLT